MSTQRRVPRTLADQFRAWPDDRLAGLLQARPDLASPAPTDSGQLASRAALRLSVQRALGRLDRLALGIATIVATAGPLGSAEVRELANASPEAVDASLTLLSDRALIWGTPDAWRPLSALVEVLSVPAGAGQSDAAVRDGHPTGSRLDEVPDLADTARDQDLIDRAGAGAAFEFVRRTTTLLAEWGVRPPGTLRSGGLGVRDLRATARLLHTDEQAAALVVETAAEAGLLAQGATDTQDAAWLPTDAYDRWLTRPAAERWAVLADAWLHGQRLVSMIGRRDGDKPVNALAPGLERPWMSEDRATTLRTVAQLAPGRALAAGTGIASVVERLRWHHPRRPGARLELASVHLQEATAIGVLALDGATSYARLLLAGDEPVVTLAPLLPAPVDHILLQADLTAVAPGPLDTELNRRLGTVADVESRGGATVYRFTDTSLRRAFDSGWSATEIKEFVTTTSRTPVPQALEFLVDDVARRFGTVRVGSATAFVRSDDETVLAELLHGTATASLRLRRLAPTVLVSDVPIDVLLPRLRDVGVAPVVEGPDGEVRVAGPTEYRARPPRPAAYPAQHSARLQARASAVVTAIRAGDRAAAQRPRNAPATTPADMVSLLRQAVEARSEVWLGYLDTHGVFTERIVRPLRVAGGRVRAHDDRSEETREFAIHRISQVRLVTPGVSAS